MLYIQLRSQNINKKNTQIHINLHCNKSPEQINITAQKQYWRAHDCTHKALQTKVLHR